MQEPEGLDDVRWDRLERIRARLRAELEAEWAAEGAPPVDDEQDAAEAPDRDPAGGGGGGEQPDGEVRGPGRRGGWGAGEQRAEDRADGLEPVGGVVGGGPGSVERWLEGIGAVVGDLAADDLVGVPVTALGEEAVALLAAAEALRTEAVRRLAAFDAGRGWVGSGARSLGGWVGSRAPVASGEARSLAATASLAQRCEALTEALAEGSVSLAAARIVAGGVTPERLELFLDDPAPLLGAVAAVPLRDVPRVVAWWRSLADDALASDDADDDHERRWASTAVLPGGRVRFRGELDAAGGAALLAGLDDLMAPDPADVAGGPRPARQRRADAFAELARGHLAGRRAGGRAPGVGVDVHLGLADLLLGLGHVGPSCSCSAPDGGGQAHGGLRLAADDPALDPFVGISEVGRLGPVARVVAARLACDADVGRVVDAPDRATVEALLGPDGPLAALRDTPLGRRLLAAPSQPLDLGRRSRPFTLAQRRAIVARDGGCQFPGCDRPPEWCDVHHLHHWEAGGPTDLANGLLLCAHHHTVVHLRRWRPHQRPDGTWTVAPPDDLDEHHRSGAATSDRWPGARPRRARRRGARRPAGP